MNIDEAYKIHPWVDSVLEWKADRLIHLFVLDLKSVGNYNNNHCLFFFLFDSVEHHCFSWRSIQAQTFPLTCSIACECSVTLKHLREASFLCLIKMIRHPGCWSDNSSLSPRWLLTPVSDKHSAASIVHHLWRFDSMRKTINTIM